MIWKEGFLRTPLCLPFSCRDSRFMEPVALAAHLDEMAVMHESIEEGRYGRSVAKQFGLILERAIRGNNCRGAFISAHDDFEQVFSGARRQLPHS